MMFDQKQLIAFSIVVGCCLVATTIFLTGFKVENIFTAFSKNTVSIQRSVKSERHLYSVSKSPITIVEFADLQCPYCSELHATLTKIVTESNGKINWEYRQLPLSIHPYARQAALTAECVSILDSPESFWKFVDTIMAHQSSLSVAYITNTATANGISPQALASCVADTKTIKRIDADAQAAFSLGGTGTPFSVIMYADGKTKNISGALPYAQWKSLLHL